MAKRVLVLSFIVVTGFLTAATTAPSEARQKSPNKVAMERGKKVYDTYCMACHQEDGAGMEGFNPPLVKTKWVLGDKKELIRIILEGMNEEIKINGETYYRAMPGNPQLKDDEVADLLTYVRNSFSNKASVVSAVEVKKVRQAVK